MVSSQIRKPKSLILHEKYRKFYMKYGGLQCLPNISPMSAQCLPNICPMSAQCQDKKIRLLCQKGFLVIMDLWRRLKLSYFSHLERCAFFLCVKKPFFSSTYFSVSFWKPLRIPIGPSNMSIFCATYLMLLPYYLFQLRSYWNLWKGQELWNSEWE